MAAGPQFDAVTRYIRSMRKGAQLKYYVLTIDERLTLDAMLACSKGEGSAIAKSQNQLAAIAGLSLEAVKKALNGYKRKNGTKAPGLKARGIVSVVAPHSKRGRSATLRINWEAFVLDPWQIGRLQERLQMNLPGVKMPEHPDSHEFVPESPLQSKTSTQSMTSTGLAGFPQTITGKPVEDPGGGIAATPGWGRSDPRVVSQRPQGGIAATPHSSEEALSVSSSTHKSSSFSDRGAVQIPPNSGAQVPPPAKQTRWDKLHPGLRHKILRELKTLQEAEIGSGPSTTNWTPEEHARHFADRILQACQRAGIWDWITEELVKEAREHKIVDYRKDPDA